MFRRYIDYFFPFNVLLLSYLYQYVSSINNQKIYTYIVNAIMSILIVVNLIINQISIVYLKYSIEYRDINRLFSSMNYLKLYTKHDELVVSTSINSFPEMLYHNRHNSYLIGMDIQYLKSKELATQYIEFISNNYKIPSQFLKSNGFSILFYDKIDTIPNLEKSITSDGNLVQIYEDKECKIFKVL